MVRKILTRICIIFGLTAFLMLFVIPIVIAVYFPDLGNNKQSAFIYFIVFLTFTAVGNISGEKASSPLTKSESRTEKIDQILN